MMKTLNLKKEYAGYLYKIFDSYCPKAEIWAYGSRLNGDSHAGSDLDLTVIDFNESEKDLCILEQLINDSNIPILVDISMFNALPHSFQNEITKGYVIFTKARFSAQNNLEEISDASLPPAASRVYSISHFFFKRLYTSNKLLFSTLQNTFIK